MDILDALNIYIYIYIYILDTLDIYIYIYTLDALNIRGSLNKFPEFFRMDTFIDSTHMEL